MEQYVIISIIGILLIAGLSAIVYFFGMKYSKWSEPSSNSPCSNDNNCARNEYCSRGTCKSYDDCINKNGGRCENRNGSCNRLSAAGGAITCCPKYKTMRYAGPLSPYSTSSFTNYCVDLEGDVLCDYDEQCKSGKCRSGKCTGPRLTASPCSGDYDCMSGICGKEGRCH